MMSKFLVVGCGPSVIKAIGLEGYTCVGVNDAARFVPLDYHVVVDKMALFSEDRQLIIANTKARRLYTHLTPRQLDTVAADRQYMFFEKDRGWINNGDSGAFNKSFHSTYIAAQVAVRLGATSLTFAGVDILGHPNFTKRQLDESRTHLEQMVSAYTIRGIKIYNLGTDNILSGIPNVIQGCTS